jgi:hypothetical protein
VCDAACEAGPVCDAACDSVDLLVKRLVAHSDKDQGFTQRHTLANLLVHSPPPSQDMRGTELSEHTLNTIFTAWPERKTQGLPHQVRARATFAPALTSPLLPRRRGKGSGSL